MSRRTVILCLLPMPLAAVALWQLELQQLLGLLSVLVTIAGACAWSLWHGPASRDGRASVPGSLRGYGDDRRRAVGPRPSDAGLWQARSSRLGEDRPEAANSYVAKGIADLEAWLCSTKPLLASEDDLRPPAV